MSAKTTIRPASSGNHLIRAVASVSAPPARCEALMRTSTHFSSYGSFSPRSLCLGKLRGKQGRIVDVDPIVGDLLAFDAPNRDGWKAHFLAILSGINDGQSRDNIVVDLPDVGEIVFDAGDRCHESF